jgi:hypothetical protein
MLKQLPAITIGWDRSLTQTIVDVEGDSNNTQHGEFIFYREKVPSIFQVLWRTVPENQNYRTAQPKSQSSLIPASRLLCL